MNEKKRVLLFCPAFFRYEEKLKQGIERLGLECDLWDERPGNGFLVKTVLRKRLPGAKVLARRYVNRVIAATRGRDYDCVLVIKSETFGAKEISAMRGAFPRARFILYLWDGLANVPGGEEKLRLYDRVFTFDPVDAERFGLTFRPLFYSDDYEPGAQPERSDYDVAFIGTAHAIRPRVARAVEAQCGKQGFRMYCYLYLPHPLVFLYNKLTNPAYRGVCRADIHFTPLAPAAVRDICSRSRCILDVENTFQRGLTMRTIEMLGMEKKLITTNELVKRHDFYDEADFCVIDRDRPSVPREFLETPYRPVSESLRRKYSLEGFLREVLEMGEDRG